MRDQYYEQLDSIVDDLVTLTGTVRRAVASSTTALLDADARLAEVVIAGDAEIDNETEAIEERALLLLATPHAHPRSRRAAAAAPDHQGDGQGRGLDDRRGCTHRREP
jgi:phosphate uptake regulator